MKNIFDPAVTQNVIDRIMQLTPETKGQWGKMSVAQMLAHCCVSYEMVYEDIHKKPNALMRLILKLFVKSSVVGPKPYPKNGQTAPAFLITDEKDFDAERQRLIDYLKRTQALGPDHFNNLESLSFGKLSTQEWNVLFYKHIDHHLTQFGV